MTTSTQSVFKKFSEVIFKVPKKISLHVSLMIMSTERKNYAAMARSTGVNYRLAYIKKENVDEYLEESMKYLHSTIKNIATKANPGYLILDFTLLFKPFSEQSPSVTYDYDGISKRVNKGFSIALVLWSNGSVTIPFDFSYWLRKKDAGELYVKKTDIVKKLIKLAQQYGIPFKEVRLDGAFATEDVLTFLLIERIHFTMRIAMNRVVSSEDGEYQLVQHPKLKMLRNEKFKTIRANYKGLPLYFTAHKRNGKKGTKEVVFIVSDLPRSPKEHVKAYDGRWPVEKCIRTKKQSLGFTHCQSTNPDKQRFHIFAVMVSYTVLQLMKFDQKEESVEEVLHSIRRQKKIDTLFEYIDLEQTVMS